MGLFGKLFSKQACGICGQEAGALSRTKLADGNYVCNACRKNMSGLFLLNRHDSETAKEHLEYMEKINELYEKEFAPLEKDYCGHHGSYKIGFADEIGMFEIVSPETKKSNKKEVFRYDQIESFGPYEVLNAMNRPEGEKRIKEYGVQIKLAHPYIIGVKIPIARNVDNPSGGDRIYAHLNAIFSGEPSKAVKTATSVASMLLDAPVASMIPVTEFKNRAKYTRLADEAEKRALGKTLKESV